MSVEHFQALSKGVRLNQYEMVGILGSGGFGITYMARDTTLDTMVAIKEYLPGDFAVRQGDSQVTAKSSTSKGDFDWGLTHFLEEARVLAKFRHPNIVHVNQIFQANNTAYIVMEYAKGESLDELLKRVGHLSEQQTKDILFPILDGLKRVHALGFLHRDIKPANIIMREEGGAVLIDFGAARQTVETKSRAITSIVTEGYAPLEQYDTKGNQGAWTDIYALGGVAYKCLTGEKPPAATSRLRNDPLVPLGIAAQGRVSREFAAAIDASLGIFENQRPQSIDAFTALISGIAPTVVASPDVDDVTRIWKADAPQTVQPVSVKLAALPATAAPAGPTAPVPRTAPTMRPVYWGVAAAVLLVVAAGGWFALQRYTVSSSAVNDAANASKAPQQLAGLGPIPPAAAPNPGGQLPSSPKATSSLDPTVPLATTLRPADQPAARPNVVPSSQPEPIAQQPPAPPPIHTSFDCAKAANDAERLVCGDRELAALDMTLADLYRLGLSSVADTNEFTGEHLGWLSRRDGCADKQCLIVAYNEGIKDLQRWVRR
jgi:serine/threonine protein kinase